MSFPWFSRSLGFLIQVAIYIVFFTCSVSIAVSGLFIGTIHILFILRCVIDRWARSFPFPVKWPYLALMASVVVSALVNAHGLDDLRPLRDFWRYFLPWVIWYELQKIHPHRILKVFLIMVCFISIYGVIQHYQGIDWFRAVGKVTAYRPDGVETGVFHGKGNFSHHLTYSHYLGLAFPVFFSLALSQAPSGVWRVIYGLGSVLSALGIFFSMGRSAWAGMIVSASVVCWQLPKKWLLVLGSTSLVGILCFFIFLKPGSSFETYHQSIHSAMKARIDSLFVPRHHRDRVFLWESAVLAIEDHFWFGIGPRQDEKVMPFYRNQVEGKHHHTFLNQASAGVHNMYLQIWLNFGLIGFLCYLTWWGSLIRWNMRSIQRSQKQFPWEKALLLGILGSYLGMMVGGLFENNFYDGEVQTLLLLLIGWSLALGYRIGAPQKS